MMDSVRMALNQLRANKLRSVLTLLGIIIGVGSVVGVVSMGEGLRSKVMGEIDKIGGSRLIFVAPPPLWYNKDGRWIRRPWVEHLKMDDANKMLEECPGVASVVPIAGTHETVKYGRASTECRLEGVLPQYTEVMDWKPQKGRFVNETDIEEARKVLVLGDEVKKNLFGTKEAVDNEVRIRDQRYVVVGVMESKRLFGDDWGRNILIPLTTAQKRILGNEYLHALLVYSTESGKALALKKELEKFFKRHHEHGSEFKIVAAETEIEKVDNIIGILKMVVGGIAGISLLVGGIGIMNIMLVSVTERTREIGIRKAIGAKRRHIMLQFLVEAVVLSLFGGAVGILFGTGLGMGIAGVIKHVAKETFPSKVSLDAVALAIGFSFFTGVFFGVYPARKASLLDPVEALRYE
jgi:putative ABC transport system permease protein